jgi:hypothetical protein
MLANLAAGRFAHRSCAACLCWHRPLQLADQLSARGRSVNNDR